MVHSSKHLQVALGMADFATQEEINATQFHEDDEMLQVDNSVRAAEVMHESTISASLSKLLEGPYQDDSDDDDYVAEEETRKKTKVVNDDDEEEDGDSASSSEEDISSDEEGDDFAPTSRTPSARQEANREKLKAQKREKKEKPSATISEFDLKMQELKQNKVKKKHQELSGEEKERLVAETLDVMNYCYLMDKQSRANREPATAKLEKLDLVLERLTNQQLAPLFVEHGVALSLTNWLRPGRKDLPNVAIRTKLFQAVEGLPFSDEEDQVKKSGIGKVLNYYRLHKDETLDNKRLTNSIISKWMDEMIRSRG